ncbi:molybdopterin cofactor-binding domain-containing protein [Lentzea guizhouensis]|uniref:molybdopterin cofactor-binding domain-containing protein n=1 Tax=Lentzea guizhouensis TaxID=1586287 RepID=UPI0008FF44BC|nr:molybdopterin cofactor-binding domain-containing protein [Lentzea guizhouensis]
MISRRTLLRGAGAGALVVAIPVPALAAEGLTPNVFVRLDDAGRITATAPRPDTGQGVRTVVALMVAEELAVNTSDITVEQAHGDTERFGPQGVQNSSSVKGLATPIRTAAATARCLLVTAAAQRWKVPVAECAAKDGASATRAGPAPLPALVRRRRARPATVPVELTPPEKWRLLARPAAAGWTRATSSPAAPSTASTPGRPAGSSRSWPGHRGSAPFPTRSTTPLPARCRASSTS